MKRRILFSIAGLGVSLSLTSQAQTAPVSTGYIYPVETQKNVWIIGQRPLDQQGQLVGQGDIDQQLTQVFKNVKTALASVQLTTDDIKQVTYHVRQLDNRRATVIRSLQEQYLPVKTGSIIEQKNVAQLVGDDMLVEVEVIAIKP